MIQNKAVGTNLESSPSERIRPSEIRRIILDEHHLIRKQIQEIENLIPKGNAESLQNAIVVFQKTFIGHLAHEEKILWPLLQTVDSWGPVRLEQMAKEHRDQRQMIEALGHLQVSELSRRLHQIMQDLLLEMAAEEKEFLNTDILRDDVITSGHFGG